MLKEHIEQKLSSNCPTRRAVMKRFLAYLTCIAAGILFGYLLGSQPPVAPSTSAPQLPISNATITSQPTTPSSTTKPSASPLEKLRALLTTATPFSSLAEAWPLIHQLPLADVKSALALIRQTRHPSHPSLLDALAHHWANLDPLDAFDNAQAWREDNSWRDRLGSAAGLALASTDPETALARIMAAPNHQAREKAATWIVPALARKDPLRASVFLSANQKLLRYDHLFRTVAQTFAQSSPHQAIAWANSLTDRRLREQAVSFAWIGWVETDPAAAALDLQKEPEVLKNAQVISSLARHWSRSDINATFKWIESLPEPRIRNEAYNAIEFPAAKLAPDRALELLIQLPSDDARNQLAEKIGQQLARDNIDEALAWAAKLPADKGRANAFDSILSLWSNTDPSAAARYLATQPTSKQHTDFLARAMRQWSENDPDSANRFLQTLPPGAERDAATAGIVQSVDDPNSATALELFRSIEDKQLAATVADRFIASLVRSDPDAAFRLASEMPADAQPKLFRDLVRSWAFEHTAEAGQWLNKLTPGPARDSAIEGYVSVIDGTDAASATQWAAAITEPTKRVEVVYNTLGRWLNEDRPAALSWYEQQQFPEGLRPFFDKMLNEDKRRE
jgi:hypothetical protein